MSVFRYARPALRELLKHPGYTIAVVMALALVIAANSAIFGAVHAVLLKPSAIVDPSGLVICWERSAAGNDVVEISYRNFSDWTTHSRSFSQAAAVGSSTWPVLLDAPGESVRLSSAGVSSSFFQTLGANPAFGRAFVQADDVPGSPRVAILSYGTWRSRFGADPGVVGRTVLLGEPHTIIGVMPPEFDFPRGTDVWLPVVPILANAGNGGLESPLDDVGVLFVIGRLRNGVTPALAAAELDRLAAELERSGSSHRFGAAVVVTPFLDHLIGPARPALWALFGAVGVLLLIGCANVSGLMLTRASLRRREQAIRFALGAEPRHVRGQWMAEALLLSLAAGCLGLIAARWALGAIVALAPEDVPRLSDVSIDVPVAAFTLVTALVTSALCAMPALGYVRRLSWAGALNDAARVTQGREAIRGRSRLAVFQIALAVVLLVAAGLVVRSFVNLRAIDLGFMPANVLTMTVAPAAAGPSSNAWLHGLLGRLAALPQVDAAGGVNLVPLARGPIGQDTWVVLEGQPEGPAGARLNPTLNYQVATPGYFRAMAIGLRRGRLFTDGDTASSPRVALVAERTARRLWPGQNPIGKRLLMPVHSPDGGPDEWRTVVGVVADVRYRGLDDVRLDVYDPALQAPSAAGDIVVRTAGNPLSVLAAIRVEARRLDSRVVIDRVTTMDGIVSRTMAPWRFSAWMFTIFAALAFALAAVGLASVASLDAMQRRHEFAVRLAVGAVPRDIRRCIVHSTLARVLPGLAVGIVAAAAGARLIRQMLFDVEPLDAVTYAAVLATVLGVSGMAAWLPARRAAGADPLALLRRS